MKKILFAATLAATLFTFAALTLVRAQTTNVPAVAPASKPVAAVETKLPVSKPVVAVETKLPVAAKSGLPRGARTIFAFKAQMQGQPVLLHGWRAAKKDDITLDILATTTARSKSRRKTRRKTATMTTRVTRLNRVSLGRMENGEGTARQISLGVAPLTSKRGTVLVFEWYYFNVSGSYSYVPLLLVTLPDGLSGGAIVKEFQGEAQSGGGTVYQGRIGPDGNFLLRKKDYGEGAASYTPYTWNGKSYVEGEAGESMDDTDD